MNEFALDRTMSPPLYVASPYCLASFALRNTEAIRPLLLRLGIIFLDAMCVRHLACRPGVFD